jgi:hypothetical protein
MLDAGFAAGELATNVREVSAEQRAELVRRAGLLQSGEHGAHQFRRDHAGL